MDVLMGSIYRSPLGVVIVFMMFVVICWGQVGIVCSKSERQKCVWRVTNTFLFVVGILTVLELTIMNRTTSERELVLVLFYSFYEAVRQPEYYRSMLMNVFLFEPLGLTLPFALSDKLQKKILITIGFGFILSVVIEIIQYVFCLGRAEVDDVICNTLGCAIGTVTYLIYKKRVVKNKHLRESGNNERDT